MRGIIHLPWVFPSLIRFVVFLICFLSRLQDCALEDKRLLVSGKFNGFTPSKGFKGFVSLSASCCVRRIVRWR